MDLQITVLDSLDNTTIPRATVFVNSQDSARTNNNGQFLLVHNGLNDQRIRVTMIGYDDWEKIVLKNQTNLLINLSRKALTLTVTLYDSDTLSPISGVLVNISAENTTQGKQSGTSGTVTFGVNASTLYAVDITSPNYEPRSGTVAVAGEDKQVEFYLLSGNRFSFVVKDKETKVAIPGAEVRLNSVLAGKTDERGILSTPVTRGKSYTIEIRKEGYETLSESRTISESDALYNAEITRAPLGAFVYVYDENHTPLDGADIYINGSLSGTTNEYGRGTFPSLVFGTYLVEVKKTGYIPSNRTVTISNKNEDYTITLAFESADLTIYVQDKDQKIIPNASIAIDGAAKGLTDDHGQFVTKIKFNQFYNITASKDGYQPASVQKQVVLGNMTTSVNISLEKTMDLGFIGIIIVVVIVVLILFAAIRMIGRRPGGRHIIRRNEI
ncbi:MAG: carboxypeptidase-like regulatory domain-containing protein [Methanoregula sp.]|nr:carboxypeptidase-like regulatory domain-containing protein [Methanoregula sp.]